MDFVHDQLATGKKIRVLTIVDIFSRYVPTLDPRFSYRAEDVVRTLEHVCPLIGYPKTIRVDQGTEFDAFLVKKRHGGHFCELCGQHAAKSMLINITTGGPVYLAHARCADTEFKRLSIGS